MDTPLTPRATSEGPSPPSRNSMEDADSSVTRKRPRLDSGDRAYRSMSADRALHARVGPDPGQHLPNTNSDLREPDQQQSMLSEDRGQLSVNGTPSKVTINVRDRNLDTSPLPLNMLPTHMSADDAIHPGQADSQVDFPSTPPDMASISSSPTRSPEIEVAEVEDMDDDPAETRWKPMISVMNIDDIHANLIEGFPYSDRNTKGAHAVGLLAQALKEGDTQGGMVLKVLADWIDKYLELTKPYESQWWQMFTEGRELFAELPRLMDGLLRRMISFDEEFLHSRADPEFDNRQQLQDFLTNFAALAARLLHVDCQTLRENAEDNSVTPDLLSLDYLVKLSWIPLYPHQLPLWRMLEEKYHFDTKIFVVETVHQFTNGRGHGLQDLSEFINLLTDRSHHQPALLQYIWVPFNFINKSVHYLLKLQNSQEEETKIMAPIIKPIVPTAFQLFQSMDHKLQLFISKQAPTLSLEISKGLVTELATLYRACVYADDGLARKCLPMDEATMGKISNDDRANFIELAWKYELLKKCIKEGRMEIRVQGVDTMQQELINVYQKYISENKSGVTHKVVEHLSDKILQDRLVDYLVGVESHPQLIQRSTNIVGFLVVTNRYTELESDVIWKAIASSQDKRTIDAIIDMVTGYLGISHYPILLYICKKLNELPIHSFDARMLNFCKTLLENLHMKWRHYGSQKLDMPPYHLCIRLIREATAERSVPQTKKREIYHSILAELHKLLASGPSDADRRVIYQECIKDISSRSSSTTGSIAAINLLLRKCTRDDIAWLETDFTITALIITEFAYFIGEEAKKSTTYQNFNDPLTVRLNLLQQIIVHIPESINAELGRILWDSMLGVHAPSDQVRDASWTILEQSAASASTSRNAFIDSCIQIYLPQADPHCLTRGALPFCQQVLSYESLTASPNEDAEDVETTIPGIELLWHVALTTPYQGLGERAMRMLVSQYLGAPGIRSTPSGRLDKLHARMVERCISQLKIAAARLKKLNDGSSSGEEDSMVIIPSEQELRSERVHFLRSLFTLKEFIQGIRSRTPASPSPKLVQQEAQDFRGTKTVIQYQTFSGGTHKSIQRLEIGDLETFEDLTAKLATLTGFSKFTLIQGGQKLDFATYKGSTLREIKLDQKGLLLVRKATDAVDLHETVVPSMKGLRPLEIEVMKHFHELYDLLGIDEQLGKDVFDFLIAFPPHQTIADLVCSERASVNQLFPSDMPFKGLYSVYTLKTSLLQRLQEGTASQDLILHGVHLTVAALIALGSPDLSKMETKMAEGLIDCLLIFLKEPVPSDVAMKYFTEPALLVSCLHNLLQAALTTQLTSEIGLLIRNCFAAMLEASLHSQMVWACFKSHDQTLNALERLLLNSPERHIREGTVGVMRSVCVELPLPTETSSQEFAAFFWESIVAMIPRTPDYAQNTEHFFDIALEIFRTTEMVAKSESSLLGYVHAWSQILLKREHNEFAGRDSVDWVMFGLASLLDWCIQILKSKKKPLNVDGRLMQDIFRTHLFPDIISQENDVPSPPVIPILHSPTRARLYSVLLALGGELAGYEKLLDLVNDLVPQGEDSQAWSWGIAQILEEYQYEPNWNFDRMKMIRSPTGYAGLRNLSNTCYLNSLFTQLFMNVRFRGFMLKTDVVDGEASQKLLSETKRLFSYMQETWFKAVDPQGIADSGINYENTPIDVSIQMDVEEFYNLLFSRWESQIPSKSAKDEFGRFYGGQIVQQIKASPCNHVSETLEQFMTIQCEIQGKMSLTESLNAYIGGEKMEGDNKYACQRCGEYRDAVKRASLKDIPDDLIFHLKRFDYDVATGMRSKINERFDFPEVIDMAAYKVEHLMNPAAPAKSDHFKLVGILVHSGTAESGHYYSYIRERPVNQAQSNVWLEFNDSDVTRFDPLNIPDQCFGGWSDASFPQMRFPKPWSAYMLFYQRQASMEREQQHYTPIPLEVPVKETIPDELQRRISFENEMWIRKFCLFDPEHAKFSRSLLEQLRDLRKNGCSDDHSIEQKAIWLSLEHLDQILSRAKDCTEFDSVLKTVLDMALACTDCCKLMLDWISQHEAALRNLLLRNTDALARAKFNSLIITGLKHLRNNDPRLYGFDADAMEMDPHDKVVEVSGAFQDIVRVLKDLWAVIHMHAKAWDDYFGLLRALAGLGRLETHVMLREGILKVCLEVLIVDHPNAKRIRIDYPHHAQYYRLTEKGRKFSLYNLTGLVETLLGWIDMEITPCENFVLDRPLLDQKYPLTKYEDSLLRFGAEMVRPKSLVILDKIFVNSGNMEASKNIMRMMALAEPAVGLNNMICKTIFNGINIEPADTAEPYLQAALAYCERCPDASNAREVITRVAHEVETIGQYGGEQHLQFFSAARRLRNDRFSRKYPNFFHRLILSCVPFWAPTLLMYPETQVRNDTIQLLQTLVFDHDIHSMDDEQKADEIEKVARDLCNACVRRIIETVIKPRKNIENKMVEDIIKVVRHCLSNYFNPDDDHQIIEEAETNLEFLNNLTVATPDEGLSDVWDAGSDVATDSESDPVFLSS